jgi:hypothetical protein
VFTALGMLLALAALAWSLGTTARR